MNTIVKTSFIVGLASLLSACSPSPDLDGKYVTSHSFMYGLRSTKIELIINGNEALLIEPPSVTDIFSVTDIYLKATKTQYHVKYADNRILVYRQSPPDGMVFHVTNNGNTLECPLCQALPKSPVIWEKIDQ